MGGILSAKEAEMKSRALTMFFVALALLFGTIGCSGGGGTGGAPEGGIGGEAESEPVGGVGGGSQEQQEQQEQEGIPQPPAAPPILTTASPQGVAAAAADGQVTLTWGPVADATSYNIYWKSAPGVAKSDAKIANAVSPYVHKGLANGTTYAYAVTAIGPNGESALSGEVSAMPPWPPPPAPQGIQSVGGYEMVTVKWDSVADAISYNLYWATNPPLPGAKLMSVGTKVASVASPYAHGNLTPNLAHYYAVTAVGKGGEGPESQVTSAMVMPPLLKVFVTSAAGKGNLADWSVNGWKPTKTGIAAGDEICQKLARDAGFRGNFNAALSDDNTDVYCHLQNLSGKKGANCGQPALPAAAGPWVLTDAKRSPFAEGIEKMFDQDPIIYMPLRYNERGNRFPQDVEYYTGSQYNGTVVFHCQNWTFAGRDTGAVGMSAFTSWPFYENGWCSPDRHLVCFQTGVGSPLPPIVDPDHHAKKVFLTSISGSGDLGSWQEAGGKTGLSAGDAICQKLAGDAGLSGTFKTWLSDGNQDAKGRFVSDGPWIRPDNVRIADNKNDLTDGILHSSIHLAENGKYYGMQPWTGTKADGTKGASHCNGWTSADPAVRGIRGGASAANAMWSNAKDDKCSERASLYCFED